MNNEYPTVLFVLDDADAVAAIGAALRRGSNPVRFAADTGEAIDQLRRNRRIAAVCVARRLRDGCGFRLLERARTLRPDVVRVLLTGTCDAAVVGALDEGLVGRWLAKPWAGAALTRVVALALDSHAEQRSNRRARVMLARRERQLARVADGRAAAEGRRARALAQDAARWRDAATGLVRLVVSAAERDDVDAVVHAERVARRAVAIGRRLGLANEELDDLRLAAMLHDVGRLRLEDAAEADPIAVATRGGEALGAQPIAASIAATVRHCRERWDGAGGPAGLMTAEIPRLARILGVACAHEEAVAAGQEPADAQVELIGQAGRSYDPEIVAALVDVLDVERAVQRDLEEAAREAAARSADEAPTAPRQPAGAAGGRS